MRTRTLAAVALLALFATACSGGGGSAPAAPAAPKAAAPSPAATAGTTTAPASTATLPPGTVGVSLVIKIPPKKHAPSAAVKAALAKRAAAALKPLYIGSTTTGVQALVTPSGQSALPTATGTCTPQPNPTSCAITIPIPIAVASQVLVTLLGSYSEVIGVASATYTAGQFPEGVSSVAPPLIFSPVIQNVTVTDNTDSFTEGTSIPSLSVSLVMTDADGNDVGGETDGVFDQSLSQFYQIALTSGGGITLGQSSFTTLSGSPASDLAVPASYDGSGVPYINATLGPGYPNVYVNNFDGTGSTTVHGLSVVGNANIEYPSVAAAYAASPVSIGWQENIPSDVSSTLAVSTDGGAGCLAITSFTGTSLAYQASGGYSLNIPLNNGTYSGNCTITATDGSNSSPVSIAVDSGTLTIQGKKRK